MPNIPQVNIGGTIFNIKDASARDQIADSKSAFDIGISSNSTSSVIEWTLEQGTISSEDGHNVNRTTRIRTSGYVSINNLAVVDIPSGIKMSVVYYADSSIASYIKTISWFTGNVKIDPIGKYCKLVFAYDDDSTIVPSVFPDSKVPVTIYRNQNKSLINPHDSSAKYNKGDIVLKENEPYLSKENGVTGTWDDTKWEKASIQDKIWNDIKNHIDNDSPTEDMLYIFEKGGIAGADGTAANNAKRIRTYSFVPIGRGFYFTIPSGMRAFVSYYETNDYASWIGITDWSTNSIFYVINPVAKYCKIVLGYIDDININPDALPNSRITISKYKSVKDAFFQIQRLLDLTRIVLYDEVVQGVHGPHGAITQSAKSLTFKQVMYIGVGKTIELHLKDGWDYSLLSGPQPDNMRFKFRHIKNRFITLSDDYVAFNITKIDPENEGSHLDVTPADFDNALIVTMSDSSTDDDTVYDPPESLGQMNCILRAKQLTSITYAAAALLPNQSRDYPSGSNIMGIPYSSTRYENNYVPNCVSFDSFMTAVMNPNSYLYTRVATAEDGESRLGNSKTYFGSVCSSFVSYCLGFDGIVYTTHQFEVSPDLVELEEQNCYALKLGDILLTNGHIVIVTEIARTKKGRIKYIEISESWPPFCRCIHYTVDGMYERFFDPSTGYKAYRYDLSKVTYTPSPWVNIDDETGNPVYNELLIPRRGDKANWEYGETVEIDIMDRQDYTHYKLYKNNVLISTTTLPLTLISLPGLTYGDYKLCMTDGTNDSDFVYWIVVATPSIQAEYIGNKTVRAVFSCENAEPASINWCRANYNNLRHLYAVYSATLLTEAEKMAGEATNTYAGEEWDNIVQSDSGKFFINIKFKTRYGIFSKDYVEITVT